MKPYRIRAQRGVTLIEVLVAILIFSFGLLGFVGLQARAIQFSIGAEDANRAALLANDLATTMVTLQKVDTTDATLAAAIVAWQDRTASSAAFGLPNAQASAVTNSSNTATLTIQWRPNSVAASAANPYNKYETQVILP